MSVSKDRMNRRKNYCYADLDFLHIVMDQAGLSLNHVTLLQGHHALLKFPFRSSFEQFIDSTLGLLADLLVAAFLANRAGDVTDLEQIGLYRGPTQVGPRSTLRAASRHFLI